MQAKNRAPARFVVEGYSSAFQTEVVWKVEAGKKGITARCQTYKRNVSITWAELLGAALLYGHDLDNHVHPRDANGAGKLDDLFDDLAEAKKARRRKAKKS